MNLFYQLAKVYDSHADIVGVSIPNQPVLVPVSHLMKTINIEILLTKNAKVCSIRLLKRGEDALTITPVTEESSAPTSGYVPPVLFGAISALASDCLDYIPNERYEKQDRYNKYMDGLKAWCDSAYTHPALPIIYKYLSKKTLMQDLEHHNVLKYDDKKGYYIDDVNDVLKATIRFAVMYDDTKPAAIWMDRDLHEAFINYYRSVLEHLRKPELCHVTGEMTICGRLFGCGIRSEYDRNRIISSNDKTGLTYLGRFHNAREACTIGYEVMQKAFAALRWLIRKQGHILYLNKSPETTFVMWSDKDEQLPDIMTDSMNSCNKIFDFDDFDSPDTDVSDLKEHEVSTGEEYAKRINKAMYGYISHIDPDDTFYVLKLDALSKGRMAVSYFLPFAGLSLLDNIHFWQYHCSSLRWCYKKLPDGSVKHIYCEHSPSPRDIIKCAYGTVHRGGDNVSLEVSDNLMREGLNTIHDCIVDRLLIPDEMIDGAVDCVSRPAGIDFSFWQNNMLMVAYAMLKYNYCLMKGKEDMSKFLEEHESDRDVLFGRIMAVFDRLQCSAYWHKHVRDNIGLNKSDRKHYTYRETEVIRQWEPFVDMPASTMAEIHLILNPYYRDLRQYEIAYYDALIEDLIVKLNACSGFTDDSLTEMYLAGFIEQRAEIRKHFEETRAAYAEKHKDDVEAQVDVELEVNVGEIETMDVVADAADLKGDKEDE